MVVNENFFRRESSKGETGLMVEVDDKCKYPGFTIYSFAHPFRTSIYSIYLSYRSYPQEHAEVQSRSLFYALKGVTSANAEIITLASFSLAQIDQREREGAGWYRRAETFLYFSLLVLLLLRRQLKWS